jgi:hypothetical protein
MMTNTIRNFGLCSTCNHRWACLSLRNSLREGIPILHCEQFDDGVAGGGDFRLRKKPKTWFLENNATRPAPFFKSGLEA